MRATSAACTLRACPLFFATGRCTLYPTALLRLFSVTSVTSKGASALLSGSNDVRLSLRSSSLFNDLSEQGLRIAATSARDHFYGYTCCGALLSSARVGDVDTAVPHSCYNRLKPRYRPNVTIQPCGQLGQGIAP